MKRLIGILQTKERQVKSLSITRNIQENKILNLTALNQRIG